MMRARTTFVKPLAADEVREQDVDPLFLVWLVSRSTEDLLASVLAPVGMTGDEMALYSVLAASPGIRPGELSRWMAAPLTSVSSYVKRLQARGHVSHRPHPTDRRSYGLELTAAGQIAHQAAGELFAPLREQVVHALGDQDQAVRESLLRIRGIVDQLRGELSSGSA